MRIEFIDPADATLLEMAEFLSILGRVEWTPGIGHMTGRSPAEWAAMTINAQRVELLSRGRIGTRPKS